MTVIPMSNTRRMVAMPCCFLNVRIAHPYIQVIPH